MLQKSSYLLNYTFFGTDDYIGACLDIYFDDWDWTVRYFVVEISEPVSSPRVLISPLAITKIDHNRKEISVNLATDKIHNSPELDTNLPISRQYEIALRRYYEWPEYWGQTDFLDTPEVTKTQDEDTIPMDEVGKPIQERTDIPDLEESYETDTSMEIIPDEPEEDELFEAEFGRSEEDVAYSQELRSVVEMKNYFLQTSTAGFSTVTDFIIDESDWNIKYLVINLRNSHENEFVLITPEWLQQIDWGAERMFISLSQEQLEMAPRYNPKIEISEEFERKIYSYFDSL